MKMRNMSKNALAVAVGAGLAAMPVLSAQAYEFSISGQVNRSAVMLDNGNDDSIFFTDNDSSSSRLRASGSGDYGGGKAGFNWEHQFESNPNNLIDLPGVLDSKGKISSGPDSDSFRKMDAWFSGDWGKLSLGQASAATDAVTEVDLGGIEWAGGVYAFPIDQMAGANFVSSTGAPIGVVVSSVITSFDGGRTDRVRYDSPQLGGALSFAVSLGNGERLEANIGGNHEFGASAFAWKVGIRDDGDIGASVPGSGGSIVPDNVEPSRTVGSASLRIGSWSFTAAFADVDKDVTGADDPSTIYTKVGYHADNGHNFAIGIGSYDDVAQDNDEAEIFQFGWGYSPNSSVDLYASWTEAELDRPGLSVDDITALQVGTRIKFK